MGAGYLLSMFSSARQKKNPRLAKVEQQYEELRQLYLLKEEAYNALYEMNKKLLERIAELEGELESQKHSSALAA